MNIKITELEPEKWIDRYYEYLKSFARKKISDQMLLEDIIQETFLAAYKSRLYFNGKSLERTWLTSILKHKIIDSYRKKSTQLGRMEQSKINIYGIGDFYSNCYSSSLLEQENSDSNIIYKELNELLLTEVNKLPIKESRAFSLKFFKRYDTEVICQELDISKDYCWVLIQRARKKITNSILNN